ncbi:MAG: NAD(P)/FAD-dependent oxidoreductase [Solirubrobacteraceae bacterium]|nr:MAG: ferredoxin--NADP(+) reductase [Solirubrobacterales bacterium]
MSDDLAASNGSGAVKPAIRPGSDPQALAADFDAVRDITVIGAGPVGLSTAFWAGMREASSRIIDSLPDIGGQLTTLYPEKWIFDVPGHSKVLARDLVDELRAQALEQFDVPVHLETTAETISSEPDPRDPERKLVVLNTDRGALRSRTVIVAGGHGAFEPKPLPGYDMAPWEGRGAHYLVSEKAAFAGKRVVIVGGGDSAMDWVINLLDIAEQITLVHRRDGFRAHEVTVGQVMDAAARGVVDIRVPYQIHQVAGNGAIERVTLLHSEHEQDRSHDVEIDCDAVLLQLGFKTALGPLKDWGFEISKGAIVVDGATMATSLDGVWACGDIATHSSKLKLIATGFGEAAIAVAQAVHSIRPEMKLQPKYSTNTGVPGAVEGQA